MVGMCRTPLHEECPKHHVHKGDPGVTPRDLWRRWWAGPSDPNVGEDPGHWERLPPTETRSHEGKAMSYT
jgi:hypothetical protein